jgi:hypothetical protein
MENTSKAVTRAPAIQTTGFIDILLSEISSANTLTEYVICITTEYVICINDDSAAANRQGRQAHSRVPAPHVLRQRNALP